MGLLSRAAAFGLGGMSGLRSFDKSGNMFGAPLQGQPMMQSQPMGFGQAPGGWGMPSFGQNPSAFGAFALGGMNGMRGMTAGQKQGWW